MRLNEIIKALSIPVFTKYDTKLLFEDDKIFVNSNVMNAIFTNVEENLPGCCLSLASAKALVNYTADAKTMIKDGNLVISSKGTRLKIPVLDDEVLKIDKRYSDESFTLTDEFIISLSKCLKYTIMDSDEPRFSQIYLKNRTMFSSNRTAIICCTQQPGIELSLSNSFACQIIQSLYKLTNDIKLWSNQFIALQSKDMYCEITAIESDTQPFDIDDIVLKYIGDKQKIPFELITQLIDVVKMGNEFGATENYQIQAKFIPGKILISTNTGKNQISKTIVAKHKIDYCIIINKMQAEMLPTFFESDTVVEVIGRVKDRILICISDNKTKFYTPAMIGNNNG